MQSLPEKPQAGVPVFPVFPRMLYSWGCLRNLFDKLVNNMQGMSYSIFSTTLLEEGQGPFE